MGTGQQIPHNLSKSFLTKDSQSSIINPGNKEGNFLVSVAKDTEAVSTTQRDKLCLRSIIKELQVLLSFPYCVLFDLNKYFIFYSNFSDTVVLTIHILTN